MDKYEWVDHLGEGSYALVYKAKCRDTGNIVAVKQFKSKDDKDIAQRELQICASLCSKYIIGFREGFWHKNLLHLVFEFASSTLLKEISDHPRGVGLPRARQIIFQLCQAIKTCHDSRIIHRDIKPENILLDESGCIKLCDFGVARTVQFSGAQLTDYVATRWYRPPENELRSTEYTSSVDIWSVGCILSELLDGRPLFPGNTQLEQIQLIQELLGPIPSCIRHRVKLRPVPRKTSLRERFKKKVPSTAIEFLERTLSLDPSQRPSASECLQHEFLSEFRKKHPERQLRPTACNHCADEEEVLEESLEEDIADPAPTASSNNVQAKKSIPSIASNQDSCDDYSSAQYDSEDSEAIEESLEVAEELKFDVTAIRGSKGISLKVAKDLCAVNPGDTTSQVGSPTAKQATDDLQMDLDYEDDFEAEEAKKINRQMHQFPLARRPRHPEQQQIRPVRTEILTETANAGQNSSISTPHHECPSSTTSRIANFGEEDQKAPCDDRHREAERRDRAFSPLKLQPPSLTLGFSTFSGTNTDPGSEDGRNRKHAPILVGPPSVVGSRLAEEAERNLICLPKSMGSMTVSSPQRGTKEEINPRSRKRDGQKLQLNMKESTSINKHSIQGCYRGSEPEERSSRRQRVKSRQIEARKEKKMRSVDPLLRGSSRAAPTTPAASTTRSTRGRLSTRGDVEKSTDNRTFTRSQGGREVTQSSRRKNIPAPEPPGDAKNEQSNSLRSRLGSRGHHQEKFPPTEHARRGMLASDFGSKAKHASAKTNPGRSTKKKAGAGVKTKSDSGAVSSVGRNSKNK